MPYELPAIFSKCLGREPEETPVPKEPAKQRHGGRQKTVTPLYVGAAPPELSKALPDKLPGKQPDATDVEKTQCYHLYMQGWTAKNLVDECNIDYHKIKNWIFNDSWNSQKDYFDSFKSKRSPHITEQPAIKAVITANRDERRKEFLEHTGKMAVEDAKHWASMTPDERLEVAPNIAALNKVDRDNIGANDDTDEKGGKGHISLTFLTQANEPGMVKVIDAPMEVQRIEDAG